LPDGPLKLPTVEDQRTQQALDAIAAVFPLKAQNLGKGSVGSEELATAAKELFLQLAVAGNRKINFGSVEVEWPGAAIESKTVEVTHGLGATPALGGVQLTPVFATATRRMFPQIVSTSSTKIALVSVCADAVPGAGVKQTIYWQAIG
jgi:hypothetical protein